MADISWFKENVDLHDLAERLGLERPQDRGNYKSPHHPDKNPSLSIYDGGRRFRDHSNPDHEHGRGTCLDLLMYVEGIDDVGQALRRLHELFPQAPPDPRKDAGPRQPKSLAEHIADKCFGNVEPAIEYLVGRGVAEEVVRHAVSRRALGFNDWVSDTIAEGEFGHGGPAVAFITRTMNPGHVVSVDMRYIDAGRNGGLKTQCQGERLGYAWYSDLRALKRARTLYVVESQINALSIETCRIPSAAAVAVRGLVVEAIDWSFLRDKRVVICMDNDEPDERQGNRCPGKVAAWRLHELLTGQNIAAHLVDQDEWEHNDVNDMLQALGPDELKMALQRLEQWAIPGMPGKSEFIKGKARVYLPAHDFARYWRYRAKEDFTTYVKKVEQDSDTGGEKMEFEDLCGFRVASVSRVTVASSTATMTGEADAQPHTLFAVSVQAPRHGHKLVRRVFEDDKLHNIDQWGKFGPVFNRSQFLRMVNILERGADLGSRHAVNYVGLAWQDGKPIINEGPDCYFTEPEKQCPYHNLTFPSGSRADARAVVEAYQGTFRQNAAAILLTWAIGGHLKAFLGFWPHMMMQADKGAGKSTLVKRLERSIAFTMFSGQSLQTEFRLLTSISHTSHPVGWEELSARRQDVIDKAVSMLQECYQYSPTKRGSDMTEFLQSAPVLLAGEDVPVKSLIGKLVRVDLTGKKGPMMPEDLPRFPVRQWLQFLATMKRSQVRELYSKVLEYCQSKCMALETDDGARRMVTNYAALMTAWRLLCEFADIDRDKGGLIPDLLQEMNTHVAETSADREPWVWIIEILLSEIAAGNFRHPFQFGDVDGRDALFVRPSHVMDHIAHTSSLRDKWNSLPVKSATVLKRQLKRASVLASEDSERTIARRREAHLVALDLAEIERYGLHAAPPADDSDAYGER